MKQLLPRLREIGTPGIYRKGGNIYFQGEVPRYAVVILDGVVKAYTIDPDGSECIVHLFTKNSVLPVDWVNGQSPTSIFNYSAVNDVRVLKVKKDEFNDLIARDAECQADYLDYMKRSQAGLLLRVTGLSQSRAISKICYTLYFLAFRYGMERSPGEFEINLRLTQSMLASLIGQTRESTAKNLKVLKDKGVVDYSSSTYIVYKKRLEDFIGEDSFRDIDVV
ncbi:Crp/Fnr family transcriptional regulator [Candidatus Saccharibacteria bacterium]|nr:MAG: Crp/Fnr family transcriptional regulator [Candidatus Saccharibacteria bacterium]